jgi:hypothetical protein
MDSFPREKWDAVGSLCALGTTLLLTVSRGQNMGDSGLVWQERNGHSMLGGQGIALHLDG